MGKTIENDIPPEEVEVKNLIGFAYEAFVRLSRRSGITLTECKRYSKKSGWVLKVSEDERTLYYMKPHSGEFTTTVILGEKAVEAALSGIVSDDLKLAIRNTRVYVEGRSIPVVVRGLGDIQKVEQLLSVKLDIGS